MKRKILQKVIVNGKLILIGEHFILSNCKSIALKIPKSLEISVIRKNKSDFKIFYNENMEPVNDKLEKIYTIIKNLVTNEKDPEEFIYKVKHFLPLGGGLGSSASLAIAFAKLNKKEFSHDLIEKSEKEIHGKSSGIDSKTILSQKDGIYYKNQSFIEFKLKSLINMIVIYTGISHNTSKAILTAEKFIQSNPKRFQKMRKVISKYSKFLYKEIISDIPNLNNIEKIIRKAHKYMKILGIVDKKSSMIIKELLKLGFRAKITGSGLGGCIFTIIGIGKSSEIDEKINIIIKKIEKFPDCKIYVLKLGNMN